MQIARLWQEEFEQDDIAIDDSLMALGASSLAVASLLERIEAQFDAKLSVGDIFKAATVEGMARTLKSRADGAGFSPLATIKAGGDKPPLFLCEGVGIYFDLASHLRDGRPVYGLITDLTESFPSIKELAAHYAEAIRAAHPSGPYHVGGVSFGGLVAYETARLLKEQGTALGVVALLDAPAPGAYRPKPLPGKLLGHSRNFARFGVPYLKKVVKARQSKRELARDRPAQLTADGAAGDMSQVRSLFRKRLRDFQPSGYAGDVALFKLKERSGMTDSLFDPALGDIDPFLGWRTYVSGDIACFELPGDHIGILREPAVRELAGHLENAFDRCEKGPG
jgi:thioesterase domain-containing protein/acyl carrier protein